MGENRHNFVSDIKNSPFSVLFQFGGEVAPTSHRNFGSKRRYFWRLEL
jgi:hypothetical protein